MTGQALTTAGEPETTEDDFLGGALRLLQPRRGYRAGIDAVLLAAAAPVAAGRAERVLDVGAGVGTVGLCVARRVDDCAVDMIERDPWLAGFGRRNIAANGLAPRCRMHVHDILDRSADMAEMGLPQHGFAHVLANPPYHDADGGTPATDPRKAAAHAMPAADLDRWARFLARMAAAGGTATVVHKAELIGPLLAAMSPRFGALAVLPIQPRPETAAIRVIVQGARGSRAPLTLLAPLILHETDGHAFAPRAAAVLRDGAALALRSA